MNNRMIKKLMKLNEDKDTKLDVSSDITDCTIQDEGEFQLEDLLEILQGPVPREGQIIIATTNKFDEIKNECPALFRPGRLTPIEFGSNNALALCINTRRSIKFCKSGSALRLMIHHVIP